MAWRTREITLLLALAPFMLILPPVAAQEKPPADAKSQVPRSQAAEHATEGDETQATAEKRPASQQVAPSGAQESPGHVTGHWPTHRSSGGVVTQAPATHACPRAQHEAPQQMPASQVRPSSQQAPPGDTQPPFRQA